MPTCLQAVKNSKKKLVWINGRFVTITRVYRHAASSVYIFHTLTDG